MGNFNSSPMGGLVRGITNGYGGNFTGGRMYAGGSPTFSERGPMMGFGNPVSAGQAWGMPVPQANTQAWRPMNSAGMPSAPSVPSTTQFVQQQQAQQAAPQLPPWLSQSTPYAWWGSTSTPNLDG